MSVIEKTDVAIGLKIQTVPSEPTSRHPAELVGAWELVSVDGIPPSSELIPFMELKEDGRVRAFGAENRTPREVHGIWMAADGTLVVTFSKDDEQLGMAWNYTITNNCLIVAFDQGRVGIWKPANP